MNKPHLFFIILFLLAMVTLALSNPRTTSSNDEASWWSRPQGFWPFPSPGDNKVKATMSPLNRFRIQLLGDDEGGSEVKSIIVPFSVERAFGSKARVPMKGTINNVPFQISVFSQ